MIPRANNTRRIGEIRRLPWARGVLCPLCMTSSRIRALYLQPAPLFGGAERQAAEQASFLPALGVDVVVVGGPGRVIADWMREAPLARFIHSPDFPGGWPRQQGLGMLTVPWRYVACGFRSRAEIARVVRGEHIDVVLASLPFSWITGTLVARSAGIPIVWRAGGARINWLQRSSLLAVTRFLRPDVLLCNGEAVRRTFQPLVPAPVAIVPNGVNTSVFGDGAGNPSRFRPLDARYVVGYAGRMAPSKRPADMIELALRLSVLFPGTRVLMAGEGNRRADYEQMARDAGADNIEFLGFVSDMASFYAACDVVVLPSQSEGCSNFLLEAMTLKKAVVAAAIPPVLELVEDGETGLVFPLGNIAELTRAVSRLLARRELRERLARRGRERVRERTALVAATRLAMLLRGLVGVPAPVPEPRPVAVPLPRDQYTRL